MVFFFTSATGLQFYMGRDKYENEDLIKYAWDRDVWFHVDKLSSAHVYLRMPEGMEWDTIPDDILEECSQLVKANSIEGVKKADLTVVYTLASNLKKTGDMDVGQVGFKVAGHVKKRRVERNNEIVKRLEKTRDEKSPDLALELQEHLDAIHAASRAVARDQKAREIAQATTAAQERAARDYSLLERPEMGTYNT